MEIIVHKNQRTMFHNEGIVKIRHPIGTPVTIDMLRAVIDHFQVPFDLLFKTNKMSFTKKSMQIKLIFI